MKKNQPLKVLTIFTFAGILALLAFFASSPDQARAAGVITTCSEAEFETALSGGGTVIFACDGTITITSVKNIASNTVIDATGYNVVLDGGGNRRIFNIDTGISLTLINLTVQNAAAGGGGAIWTRGGILNIQNSRFLNNQATLGGVIFADVVAAQGSHQVEVRIENSIFENNSATNNGGAIFVDGGENGINVGAYIAIENSIFRNNQTTGDGDGGAILANFHVTLNSEGSLYENNIAQGDGGAITTVYTDVVVNLANNTFSGNAANQDGSGGTGGALNLKNSNLVHNTFSGNSLDTTGNHQGSAIYWATGAYTGTSRDNIFYGNTGSTYECMQGNSTAPYGSDNLTDDGSCNAGTTADPVTNFDTTLQDNGGPTETHALLSGSNAIDSASDCTYASSGTNDLFTDGGTIYRDQRGAARPYSSVCDKGAYEVRESLTWGNCSDALSGSHDFVFTGGITVTVEVITPNGLNCITVEEMGSPHLLGDLGIQLTNDWWRIDGNINSGFDINLTLPASFIPDAGDQVCRYDSSVFPISWDCAANDINATSITRNNVTDFSDWTTFEDQSPTAVSLTSFHAQSGLLSAGIPLIFSLFLAGSFLTFGMTKSQRE